MSKKRTKMPEPKRTMEPESDELLVIEKGQTPTTQFEMAINMGMATTAVEHPRQLTLVHEEVGDMVSIVAHECEYMLPRKSQDGSKITGPSIRFAECLVYGFRNCEAGSRVVSIGKKNVVCQGVFRDLERNTRCLKETVRRITKRDGTRFSDDMINVTANAGCSIAMRNAILTGIPKGLWMRHFLQAQKIAGGDAKSVTETRGDILEAYAKIGVGQEEVMLLVNALTWSDIGQTQIRQLRGYYQATVDGHMDVASFLEERAQAKRARNKAGREEL